MNNGEIARKTGDIEYSSGSFRYFCSPRYPRNMYILTHYVLCLGASFIFKWQKRARDFFFASKLKSRDTMARGVLFLEERSGRVKIERFIYSNGDPLGGDI